MNEPEEVCPRSPAVEQNDPAVTREELAGDSAGLSVADLLVVCVGVDGFVLTGGVVGWLGLVDSGEVPQAASDNPARRARIRGVLRVAFMARSSYSTVQVIGYISRLAFSR